MPRRNATRRAERLAAVAPRLRARLIRHRASAVATAVALVAVIATACAWPSGGRGNATTSAPAPPTRAAPVLSAKQIARLPEAGYDRVIGGLMPVTSAAVAEVRVGRLRASAPLYRTDRAAPIARMQATGPFGDPNPIVVIATAGEWHLVLTPARRVLPSASARVWAPAQTAAWTPARYLRGVAEASARITVNVRAGTMRVTRDGSREQVFRVGVGATGTPTPTGVTGYLEARFINPASGTRGTRVQLTSLHTTTADDPAGGPSGGLIALHWWPNASGAVSHGCVRLSEKALAAVDALPLGTPIVLVDG